VIIARSKADQNLALLDPWSAVHAGTGLACGLLGLPMAQCIGAAIIYEVIESQVESRASGLRLFKVSSPERLENQLVDVAVFAIGIRLGQLWNASGK